MLNTFTAEKHQTVLEKVRKEANHLHNENPQHPIRAEAAVAIPTISLRWNVNDGDLSRLEHYRKCILPRLRKGVPKRRNYNAGQLLKH